MDELHKTIWGYVYRGTILGTLVIGVGLAGCPQANYYWQQVDGQAQLAKAESTRQTRVLEAKAERDAASLRAEAEVIRAGGVAKANEIIAGSLGGPDGYLRYLYIDMLRDTAAHGGREVIYVPTEASLPILESTRLKGTPPARAGGDK